MIEQILDRSPLTRALWARHLIDVILPSRNPRPVWLSAGVAALIVAVATMVGGPLTRQANEAWIGGSIGVYFDVAVNWAYCGRYGRTTSWTDAKGATVSFAQLPDLSLYDKSVPAILQQALGQTSRFCELPSSYPPDLYEPSLMLVEAGVLRLWPEASLRDVARNMAVGRLVLLWGFAWWLVAAGYSLPFVAAAAGSAVYITLLLGGNALYSNYPFVLPVTLLLVALAERASSSRRAAAQVMWYLALGFGAAFLGSVRTSAYPLGLALCGLALLSQVQRLRPFPRVSRMTRLALSTVALAAGLATFQYAFIKPLAHEKFVRHYHMIAHPIVLGLANPPNPLAEREGIAWDDRSGVVLAKRMDPTVGDDTMGERYEQALYAYLAKLWIYYPSEMLEIYRQKFAATTDDAYRFLESPQAGLFWPHKNPLWMTIFAATAKPAGVRFTAGGLALIVIVSGWLLMRMVNRQAGLVVLALGSIGFLSFLEAAITLGQVVLWYTPVFVFSLVCFGLLPLEGILTLLRGRPQRDLVELGRSSTVAVRAPVVAIP